MPYRAVFLLLLLPALGQAGSVFTRDGLTDGDTFYLAPQALADSDPALQSWVTFSLMRSTCKLEIGGAVPSRNSSFDCEFRARRHLVTSWDERRQQDPALRDDYLDALAGVHDAGFLAEYTAHYFGRRHWRLPDGLRLADFDGWRREHLAGHRPRTRLIGSWNFARIVSPGPDTN